MQMHRKSRRLQSRGWYRVLECNTIDPGEDTPEPYGIIFPEKESDECLYAPDIQVVYPPESKSIDQTFQKNKDVNDEEYFLSKHKCIHKDQKGDDLNIGQETKET